MNKKFRKVLKSRKNSFVKNNSVSNITQKSYELQKNKKNSYNLLNHTKNNAINFDRDP